MLWVAGAFFLLFLVRVLIDPRVMRAGVYLLLGLAVLGLWVLFTGIGASQQLGDGAPGWILIGLLALAVVVVFVLTVMLILNGVTMLRREGRRLGNMLSLVVGILFAAEIVWACVALAAGSALMAAWAAVVVIPTAYVSFGFLAYVIYSALYQLGTRLLGGPVATVVVLGSGLIRGEVPPLLASRLNRGKAVMRRSAARGQTPVIVVSGGKGSDESRPEAAAMAEYLVMAGVEPERILEEDQSRTTQENIANTGALLAERGIGGRVALVTNNFHAFRSALLMRRQKMRGYVIGAPTASYYWPSASIREFIAIIRDHPWFTVVVLGITWLPVLMLTVYLTVTG